MATPTTPLIPITVIGGYLGAGKTTLLNRMLRDPGGRRLGVIVNDFGSIGIDAELLSAASDGGVVNLPNGCVCCTLGGDLFEALSVLRDGPRPPDQIVIEASGVADPAVAAAWGTSAGFEPGGVIVLAALDSIRRQLVDKYVGDEIRRQLAGADVVVLTKTDLCSSSELGAARSAIRKVSGAAAVDGSDVPIEVILGAYIDGGSRRASEETPGRQVDLGGFDVGRTDRRHCDEGPPHEDRYVRWSWTGGTVDSASVGSFLQALPRGLLRLKGWLTTVDGQQLVQVVGSSCSVLPSRPPTGAAGSRLEAIGIRGELDTDALTAALAAATR